MIAVVKLLINKQKMSNKRKFQKKLQYQCQKVCWIKIIQFWKPVFSWWNFTNFQKLIQRSNSFHLTSRVFSSPLQVLKGWATDGPSSAGIHWCAWKTSELVYFSLCASNLLWSWPASKYIWAKSKHQHYFFKTQNKSLQTGVSWKGYTFHRPCEV